MRSCGSHVRGCTKTTQFESYGVTHDKMATSKCNGTLRIGFSRLTHHEGHKTATQSSERRWSQSTAVVEVYIHIARLCGQNTNS